MRLSRLKNAPANWGGVGSLIMKRVPFATIRGC
jgi:hypothetical protein